MDVREKLIELIVWIEDQMTRAYPYTTDQFRIETTVDHLIANGVTVQEWIPATERLPEDNVLVVCLIGDTDCPEYDILRWDNADYRWDNGREWFYHEEVTHWMPLPQLPKRTK